MKAKNPTIFKIIVSAIVIFALFFLFLWFNNDIGTSKAKLEQDIRSSQKIQSDWIVSGEASKSMAAFISYPEDQSSHTFSVYVNRPGLSFGYFFRLGGSASEIDESISQFSLKGYDEVAYISMNHQKAERLEIDDGDSIRTIDIDSNQPFSIVLPKNAGTITFYDVNGNPVNVVKRPL